MTPTLEATSGTHAALMLRRQIPSIIEIWIKRCRATVPAARKNDPLAVQDALPNFLEQLARTLETPPSSAQSEINAEVAREHGEERANLGNYSLEQVIFEYSLLREVLVQFLDQEKPLTSEARRCLHAFIDEGIRKAASRFSEIQKQDTIKWVRDLHQTKSAVEQARNDLHQFFMQAPVPMVILEGPDHLVTLANPLYEKLAGRSVLGKTIKEAFDRGEADYYLPILDGVYQTGTPYIGRELPLQLTDANGKINPLWIDIGYYPFRDEQGNTKGVFALVHDVTDQVVARSKIEESEARYRDAEAHLRLALQSAKMGSWYLDVKANVMWGTPALADLYGLNEIGGDVAYIIANHIHPDDAQPLQKSLTTAVFDRSPYYHEFRIVRPDGAIRWNFAAGNLTFAPDGTPERLYGVQADITEQVEAKQALQHAKQSIENERENFYQLFRQTPEMVCVLSGPEHVFEFVNEAHVRALGFDATGMSVRKAQPESIEVHGILDEVYQTGKTAELREIAVTVTDRVRYFNLTYSARRNARGIIDGVMILGSEISEVVQARKILESREEELREFLDAIPASLWNAQPDGTIDFFNRFWFEYSEQDRWSTDSKASEWAKIMHPDDFPRFFAQWQKAIAEESNIDHEFRLKRASDGVYRWHRSRGSPVREKDGTIKRWAGYNSDTHDEKTALEELKTERDLRERFVAALSHDLRTPMASARMNAQLLHRKATQPEAIKMMADRIVSSMDRMDTMIRDLLDASRIKAGEGIPIFPSDCHLDQLVISVTKDLQQLHGARFEVMIQPGSFNGEWDCSALRRVMENLVGNAVKYGQLGTIIQIGLAQSPDWVELSVHNEGNPIAPDDLKSLFHSYRRTETAVRGGQQGWGIGLSLVQGIAEAHHGSAWATSDASTGTTFFVRLPWHRGPST